MNVEVLAIENKSDAGAVDVCLRVGQQESTVRFTTGITHIGDQPIQTLDYEQSFWESFKFNQRIIFRVMGLVRRLCLSERASLLAGETVELPIVVGRLHTPEELQAGRFL
jgi:hypothetical protein